MGPLEVVATVAGVALGIAASIALARYLQWPGEAAAWVVLISGVVTGVAVGLTAGLWRAQRRHRGGPSRL